MIRAKGEYTVLEYRVLSTGTTPPLPPLPALSVEASLRCPFPAMRLFTPPPISTPSGRCDRSSRSCVPRKASPPPWPPLRCARLACRRALRSCRRPPASRRASVRAAPPTLLCDAATALSTEHVAAAIAAGLSSRALGTRGFSRLRADARPCRSHEVLQPSPRQTGCCRGRPAAEGCSHDRARNALRATSVPFVPKFAAAVSGLAVPLTPLLASLTREPREAPAPSAPRLSTCALWLAARRRGSRKSASRLERG